ncbi:MAG TPA: hypothetical protein VN259_06455 [Xanthomonadales bacterium]|nr:hypothetical protein [Xanthomonadales bacterium]
MRNRNWSDLIIVAMIALCVGTVAKPQSPQHQSAGSSPAIHAVDGANLADAAQSLAVAVLLTDHVASSMPSVDNSARAQSPSAADRAMTQAAQAAGEVATGIEMPFFSFGGDASAE